MYYYHSRGLVGLSRSSRAEEGHLFTKPRSNSFEDIAHPNYVLYPIQSVDYLRMAWQPICLIRPYILCDPTQIDSSQSKVEQNPCPKQQNKR